MTSADSTPIAANRSHMRPHLATPSSFAVSGGHPTGAGRVAFWGPATVPRPRPPLPPRARGVRRDGGVRTAEQPTFYDLLGISSEGTFEDVRAAYRRMARKYHPDVSPPDAAAENTRRFIEVQEAYETLSDPSRRATYDRALARGVCRLAFSASRRASSLYEVSSLLSPPTLGSSSLGPSLVLLLLC